jgi:glycosyltransferase involved in cell wall biosynthesis
MQRIKMVCQKAGSHADGLLIRGMTPQQYPVWKSAPVRKKSFLLVGSLNNQIIEQSRLKRLFITAMRRKRMRDFDTIVREGTLLMANSPLLVGEFREKYGSEAAFIPTNALSRAEFSPFVLRKVNTPWQLLYCGRLDFAKGLQELLQAVAILMADNQAVHLTLAAPIVEPGYSQLKSLIEILRIEDQVEFSGRLPYGPQLFQKFRQADIFILPSYSEGFPHVIWEAAANCCPVIATRVGGIPALWQHGIHGWLISPKNADEIAAGVWKILRDERLRSRLIGNAYQYAQQYTVEKCASRLAEHLAEAW